MKSFCPTGMSGMKFQQCILLENVTSSTGTDNLGKCPNPMTIRIVTIGKIANLKLPAFHYKVTDASPQRKFRRSPASIGATVRN